MCYFRLQHEVSVLQQQVCESRGLVQSLQCELQVYQRVCGVATNTHSGTIKRLLKPLNVFLHSLRDVMTLKILHSCFVLFCGCSLKPPTAELNKTVE